MMGRKQEKTTKKRIFAFLTALILIVIFIGIYDLSHTTLEEAPHGKLIKTYDSPTHAYTARAFLINNGGATIRTAIRVDIVFNHQKDKPPKTIYFEYDRSEPEITWLSPHVIQIYNHKLNIFKDTYNWQNDKNWDKERHE
jgi:hypothetical protein